MLLVVMGSFFKDYAATATGGAGKDAGMEMIHANLSASVAKRFGNISFGLAPILAIQTFKRHDHGQSGGFSNNADYDIAFGVGARAGVEWAVSPGFRVAIAGSTPQYMQNHGKYASPAEFPHYGNLNIPATVQAGVAFDIHAYYDHHGRL